MEQNKKNRMAVAGFVLSLMGAVTVMVSPLQLTALLLSLASGSEAKPQSLRRTGIVLSSIFLGLSLLLWVLFFCNADGILHFIYNLTY